MKKIIALFIVISLFIRPLGLSAAGAIARDASSSGSSTGSTSLTVSHTIGAGSNTILNVAVFSTAGDNVTGVTYNGTAMTQAVKGANSYAGGEVYIYYLVAPTAGAHNIVVSKTGTTGTLGLLAESYTGASQTGQPDSSGSGYSATRPNSWSQTVTTQDSWLFGMEMNNGTPTASTNTSMIFTTALFANEGAFDSNANLNTGSNSFAVTSSIASDIQRISITFSPAAVAPSTAVVNNQAILFGDW